MPKSKKQKRKGLGTVMIPGDRGLEYIRFTDDYSSPCILQQSSSSLPYVWLGKETCGFGKMHLSKKQVEALIADLQRWVKTGSFQ